MKKRLLALVAAMLVLILVVASCAPAAPAPPAPPDPPPAVEATPAPAPEVEDDDEPADLPPGTDIVEVGDWRIGIITGTVTQGEEEYLAAMNMENYFGSDRIASIYPQK